MITENDEDSVFLALGHRIRRRILDLVKASPGITVGELAKSFDVSRIAVINHLATLEKAGLLVSEKDKQSRRLHINTMPLQLIYERWTDEYSAMWSGRVSMIKKMAELSAGNEAIPATGTHTINGEKEK